MAGGRKGPWQLLGLWVVPRGRVRRLPSAHPVGGPVAWSATGVETESTCPMECGQSIYGFKPARLIGGRQELCGHFELGETHRIKACSVFCRNAESCRQRLWIQVWVGEWMHSAVPVQRWLTKVTVEMLNMTVKRVNAFDKKILLS